MVVGSVGIDFVTKNMAEKELLVWSSPNNLKEYRGATIPVYSLGDHSFAADQPKFYLEFNFTYVRNQGAAWGMLSDMADSVRIPFFYLVTLIAVMIIIFYLRSTPPHHKLARFALILILSGAIGNCIDRIRLGYVIDFLDFRWVVPLPFQLNINIDFFPKILDFLNMSLNTKAWIYDFPKFNWADSTITVGVSLLIIDMLILDPIRRKKEHSGNSIEKNAFVRT